jgi:hypothetical protein
MAQQMRRACRQAPRRVSSSVRTTSATGSPPQFDALRAVRGTRALVSTYNAEVLARNPALDELFVYEKLKHRRRAAAYARDRLRLPRACAARFDCVIVAPAPQIKPPPRPAASSLPIPVGRPHEVERVFELGRELGVKGTPGPMRIIPDREYSGRLRSRLGAGPFVALHISARRPAQRWPLERYAALARELGKSIRVLLLWARSQDDPQHPGDDGGGAGRRAAQSGRGAGAYADSIR